MHNYEAYCSRTIRVLWSKPVMHTHMTLTDGLTENVNGFRDKKFQFKASCACIFLKGFCNLNNDSSTTVRIFPYLWIHQIERLVTD